MEVKKVIGYAEKISDVPQKPKLSVDEQIEHMKCKGIKFNIVDESSAKEYISNNTYYFKLKAYAKLYDKYKGTENEGKYINLEFAYLKDLATLDCYLRKIIISMSLDIEHYLKVVLLNDFNNTDEDGYKIVQEFLKLKPKYYAEQINEKTNHKACSNLVQKYSGNFAIWNIIEILSFNNFSELYSFFYSKHPEFSKHSKMAYLINPVRLLRNAAAHNNCLLNSLKIPYVSAEKFNTNYTVNAFLGKLDIPQRQLNKNMQKPFVHDFCVMLYLYHRVAPINVQKYTFDDIKKQLESRFIRHRDYYQTNPIICSAYNFVLCVVNEFIKICEKSVDFSK